MSISSDKRWTSQDAMELYNVQNWSKGYFTVGANGNLLVTPFKTADRVIDLKALIDQLRRRGIQMPILLRFNDIIKHRLGEIYSAFNKAIAETDYKGGYCCIYPIKVNQQRHVVEEILKYGPANGVKLGIEAGSKPELLAVLGSSASLQGPMICNGFKDDEFIEMAILAQKIGKEIIPVVEKWAELESIVRFAKEHNVRPILGIRTKLSSRGAGRWEMSAGVRSKFGLTTTEMLDAFDLIKQNGFEDGLKLLHFHLGSQITNIRSIKNAVTEAARLYTELTRMGAGLRYLDVGGGLGVDYDGSQTNFESSMNYNLEEYASDVIHHVASVCDEAGVAHPTILTESGRAVAAYHSVLVVNVINSLTFDSENFQALPTSLDDNVPQPVWDLFEANQSINRKNFQEMYNDAITMRDDALNLFKLGYLSLPLRCLAEKLYWSICTKVLKFAKDRDYVDEEYQELQALLADIYFCNFSLFQSIPDSWAIKQLFPVMPIHRLDEEPTRRGILADITCDSDGKIDRFTDLHDVKKVLELHNMTPGQDYYLGAFLLGAYQEILGDLHNLFGDTNAVHVSLEDDGEVTIDTVVKGNTVREVLNYVQYSADTLINNMRLDVERAVRAKTISLDESTRMLRFYEQTMEGYTYLTNRPKDEAAGTNGHGGNGARAATGGHAVPAEAKSDVPVVSK
ncbi:MAG: biosynthetic arginine decarboxylase [Planctomycetota bacterium]